MRGGREANRAFNFPAFVSVAIVGACRAALHCAGDNSSLCHPVDRGHLVQVMGATFVVFEDMSTAPGFASRPRWTEEVQCCSRAWAGQSLNGDAEQPWLRSPINSSEADCASLHSSKAPVMLNTHSQVRTKGKVPTPLLSMRARTPNGS